LLVAAVSTSLALFSSAAFGTVDDRHDVPVFGQPLRRRVMLHALRLVDNAQRHFLGHAIGQRLRLHGMAIKLMREPFTNANIALFRLPMTMGTL
jgi:hypothetical protein